MTSRLSKSAFSTQNFFKIFSLKPDEEEEIEELYKDPFENEEGMEVVRQYERHAAQAYLWPAPLSDNDEREIGPYPHDADHPRSYQLRSPWLDWDDKTDRRMFGEVLPEEWEAYSTLMPDVEKDFTVPFQLCSFIGVFGSIFLFVWLGHKYGKPLLGTREEPRNLPYWHLYYPNQEPRRPAG